MSSKLVINILIALLSLSVNSDLIELTIDNFKQHFGCDVYSIETCSTSFNNQWFIMFMAPWCGHCKKAKPQFEAFTLQSKKESVGKTINKVRQSEGYYALDHPFIRPLVVNCDDQRQLCRQFGVRGYPTFVYITSEKKGIKYKGQRTGQSFMNFTLFHNPEKHQFGEYVSISHSYWVDLFNELKSYVLRYWVQIIIFVIIGPSLVGYLLGRLVFGRTNPKQVGSPVVRVEQTPQKQKTQEKSASEENKKQE